MVTAMAFATVNSVLTTTGTITLKAISSGVRLSCQMEWGDVVSQAPYDCYVSVVGEWIPSDNLIFQD